MRVIKAISYGNTQQISKKEKGQFFDVRKCIQSITVVAAIGFLAVGCSPKDKSDASTIKSESAASAGKLEISCRPNHKQTANEIGTFGNYLEVSLEGSKNTTFAGAEYSISVGGYASGQPVEVVTEIKNQGMAAVQIIHLDPNRGSAGDSFTAALVDSKSGPTFHVLGCNASYNR